MKYLFLLLLPVLGCEARPPERDPCYVAADADALRDYLNECGAYEDTRECPTDNAIEARHGKALGACK